MKGKLNITGNKRSTVKVSVRPLPLYAFGSSMPGYSYKADSADGYRFGFNTQEREPELGDGISSAEFWMYDGKLGRRWNMDPKPLADQSQYSCLRNNPFSFTDIKGDATRFYNTKGELKYTLNDNLKNEIVFALDIYLNEVGDLIAKGINSESSDERDYTAKALRDPKAYKDDFLSSGDKTYEKKYIALYWGLVGRITSETESEMKRVADYASDDDVGKEIAVLFFPDKDKILRVKQLAIDPNSEARSMDFMRSASLTYGSDKVDYYLSSAFAWGHVHIKQNLSLKVSGGQSYTDYAKNIFLAEPTMYDDYHPQLLQIIYPDNITEKINFQTKQSLALILTSYGYSIYRTQKGDFDLLSSSPVKKPDVKTDYYLYSK